MQTFSILETPPATSDNSEALVKVSTSSIPADNTLVSSSNENTSSPTSMVALANARFTDARVGKTFPLCCPQHPLLSQFDAKGGKDLDLGFCQVM